MSIIRKRYTKAEKLEIVNESLDVGVHLKDLAQRYCLHQNTISKWRRELSIHKGAAFPGNGNAILNEEQRELKNLRKELKESQIANEILKKALGIISSPSKRNLLS